MIGSSDSFIVVEFCPDTLTEDCDEIAIILFGILSHVKPIVHKLIGWREVAARLTFEELTFVGEILDDIAARIGSSPGFLGDMLHFENAIRIRGPFSVEQFGPKYGSKLLH